MKSKNKLLSCCTLILLQQLKNIKFSWRKMLLLSVFAWECISVCLYFVYVCVLCVMKNESFFFLPFCDKERESSVFLFFASSFCFFLELFFHRSKLSLSIFLVLYFLCVSFSFFFFLGFEGKVHFFNFTKIHNAVRVFLVFVMYFVIVFVWWQNYIIFPPSSSSMSPTPLKLIHLKPSQNQLPHSLYIKFSNIEKPEILLCAGFRKYFIPCTTTNDFLILVLISLSLFSSLPFMPVCNSYSILHLPPGCHSIWIRKL